MATNDEEAGWLGVAAAVDGGKGFPLHEIDPENTKQMDEVYAVLGVEGIGAQTRLKRFIKRLKWLGPSQQTTTVSTIIHLELYLGTVRSPKITLREEQRTMYHLEEVTRDVFGIRLARLAFTFPDGVPLKNDSQLQAIPPNELTGLIVSPSRVGFSSISTAEDALKLVGHKGESIPTDNSVFPKLPEEKKIEEDNPCLNHAVSTLQRLDSIVPLFDCCEARRLYIDPILLASAEIAGKIEIQVEKVYASHDVHGPVDYVFKFKDQTVCVTVGKKDNLDGGVIQNIAQLSAVFSGRKRKSSEISAEPIYGIATTYLEWIFLKLENGRVTMSSVIPVEQGVKDDVRNIIEKIVAILEEGKDSIDRAEKSEENNASGGYQTYEEQVEAA